MREGQNARQAAMAFASQYNLSSEKTQALTEQLETFREQNNLRERTFDESDSGLVTYCCFCIETDIGQKLFCALSILMAIIQTGLFIYFLNLYLVTNLTYVFNEDLVSVILLLPGAVISLFQAFRYIQWLIDPSIVRNYRFAKGFLS